jgi:hypothetical protein
MIKSQGTDRDNALQADAVKQMSRRSWSQAKKHSNTEPSAVAPDAIGY